MKIVVAATLLAASLVSPATAHADDPTPTVDQVVAVLAELTDPNIPAANKGDIVTPGFSSDEAGTVDNHLYGWRRHLPVTFVVTDIQPAPDNSAGATVATVGSIRQTTHARSIVLVDQGGHWLVNHDSALAELNAIWRAASRYIK
jgi:hypothetical protein